MGDKAYYQPPPGQMQQQYPQQGFQPTYQDYPMQGGAGGYQPPAQHPFQSNQGYQPPAPQQFQAPVQQYQAPQQYQPPVQQYQVPQQQPQQQQQQQQHQQQPQPPKQHKWRKRFKKYGGRMGNSAVSGFGWGIGSTLARKLVDAIFR